MPAAETRALEHAVRWRVARVRVGLGQRGLTGVEVAHRVVDARRGAAGGGAAAGPPGAGHGGGGRTYDFAVGGVGAHCAEVCELALRKHEHIRAVDLTHVAHVPADRPIALSLVTTRGRVLTACALEFRNTRARTRVTRLAPPPPRELPARGARERKGRREEHVVVGLRVEYANAVLERVGLVCAPLIDVPRRWPKERAPEREAAPWDEDARDAAARERRTREADLRHHADNVARAREAALAALSRGGDDLGEQEDQWMVSGRNASAPPPPTPAIAVPATDAAAP